MNTSLFIVGFVSFVAAWVFFWHAGKPDVAKIKALLSSDNL